MYATDIADRCINHAYLREMCASGIVDRYMYAIDIADKCINHAYLRKICENGIVERYMP